MRTLVPNRQVWPRALVVLGFAALTTMLPGEWYAKVWSVAAMTLVVGSFPVARVDDEAFERGMVIAFIPLRNRRWSVGGCRRIEFGHEADDEFSTLFFSGSRRLLLGWLWLWWWFFDWAIPWFGGSCSIWLRSQRGKRILAWQGNSERYLQENLDILRKATGLPAELK